MKGEKTLARKPASRKYQLTINNPVDRGFKHDAIKNILNMYSGVDYWCLCDEIGNEGTPHTHVYTVFANAVMFTTLQKKFYGAHIEPANGSNQQNRDYIRKEGKWLANEKHETNLIDTFDESGQLPPDREASQKETAAIYEMIKNGASNFEILEAYPNAMNKLDKIDRARQTIRAEHHRKQRRELDVTYIWGDTGVGKTRSVMDKYGDENIYRVTNYDHPFDGYDGEDVILFDEFRSSIPFSDMLNYVDIYSARLSCRYNDKQALYTKVFIISNIPLEQQYPNIQREQPKSWAAFLRRIKTNSHMLPHDNKGLTAWIEDPEYEDQQIC
jgi:hypothetical protein